ARLSTGMGRRAGNWAGVAGRHAGSLCHIQPIFRPDAAGHRRCPAMIARLRRRLLRTRMTPGRLLLDLVLVVALVFLVLPLAVVFPVSVTPSSYFRFPPGGFSLRWYEDFFGDSAWLYAGWLSLR